MIPVTTCQTCGGSVPARFAGRGLCPTCLLHPSRGLQSAFAPDRIPASDSEWHQVFPQFDLQRPLRTGDDCEAWLARDLDHGGRPVVLQVVSGTRLASLGGAVALVARAHHFQECEPHGFARVLEAGDLSDAFYLLSACDETWTPVSERADVLSGDALATCLQTAAETVAQGLDAGLGSALDLKTTFFDRSNDTVIVTPSACPPDRPAPAHSDRPASTVLDLQEGAELGDFVLEEKIGEGGFGEVWRAVQERPVRRTVALKILKHGLGSTRQLARFEVEQQALARLDHAHIARFFHGDTAPDGRPFFAMEWINGASITNFCTATSVPLPGRIQLFEQVCEAIQHAHQKGIIHRDLKASNVLVAPGPDAPVVKVIDFGIARALEERLSDQTLITRAAEVVGTPATMSPEQVNGQTLDARTDIYGLGVLLYGLFTGKLPFDPDQPGDLLRQQIREDDPAKPSSRLVARDHRKALEGDLDWIVMRCLEKDPVRRYPSTSALLKDLQRHRNDEPVDAGPPELAYRVKKFVRRNTAGLAVAATLVLMLVTATIVSLGSAQRARTAQGVADEALQDMRGAFGDLDSATYRLMRTADEQRIQTVHALLEEGTAQFNRHDGSALFTLAETVAAAGGDEKLVEKALEIWTAARALMPGTVQGVHRIPSEQWSYLRGDDEASTDHFLIIPGPRTLQVKNLETGETTEVTLDPRLASASVRLMGTVPSTRVVLWSTDQAVFQVWSMSENPPRPITDCIEVEGISGVILSPEGDRLATRTDDDTLILWTIVKEGTLVREESLKLPANTFNVSFSPSWRQVVFQRTTEDPANPPFVNVSLEVFDLERPSLAVCRTWASPGKEIDEASRLVRVEQ